jgi:hypothetical protein
MALDDADESAFITSLVKSFRRGETMGNKGILQMDRANHDQHLSRGWAQEFIGRHFEELQTCGSRPQENLRLIIARA